MPSSKVIDFIKYLIVLLLTLFCQLKSPVLAIEAVTLRKNDKSSMTLSNAEFLVMANNPNLAYSKQSYKYNLMAYKEAKLRFLPTFSAFSNYAYTNNPVLVFSSLLMQQRFTTSNFGIHSLNNPNPINNFLSAIYTNVPVFSGLQLETGLAIARLNKEKQSFAQRLLEQQLRLNLIKEFYKVVLINNKLNLIDNSIEAAKIRLKKIKDLNSTGMVTHADVLTGQLELSKFKQAKIATNAEMAIAKARLAALLGDMSFFDVAVIGDIESKDIKIENQQYYVDQAILNRPDYKMANTDIAISTQNVRNAFGKFLPKANFYAAGINSGNAVVNGGSSFLLGANVSIKVLDASLFANEKKAKIARQMAYEQYKQKKLDIYVEVVNAYSDYIASQEKLSVNLDSIEKARANLKIIQDRYSVGLVGISDLVAAQNYELTTKVDYVTALYENKINLANLFYTCGILNDTKMF